MPEAKCYYWIQDHMTKDQFVSLLTAHSASFAKAVATNEGDWIVKGFIDIYKKVYSISVDTKIVSKVLELLLFPMFVEFGKNNSLKVELSPQQNSYPDLSFIDENDGAKFAVDIKSTYRTGENRVNGMTLGAFTGYFRERKSNKNTLYPYGEYAAHIVLGVIYTQSAKGMDERQTYTIKDLPKIPSVIKDFQFFVQPKFRIASAIPGSGNTKNIGAVKKIDDLINGKGPFAELGEEVYDDYWRFFLAGDMAQALKVERPYTNLKTYLSYKEKGIDVLKQHVQEINKLAEDEDSVEQETDD